MRSNNLVSVVLFLFFCIMLLCVPVFADNENHPPTLIIPTKFRYLLSDMAQAIESQANQTPVPVPSIAPAADVSHNPEDTRNSSSDEEILPAGLIPDRTYSGMGRGFVQTNFDVSFEEPGQKIYNSERLTARGLFNVHVTHGFN